LRPDCHNSHLHVLALGFLNEKAIYIYSRGSQRHNPIAAFAVVIGATALLATLFHAIEASIWAVAYCFIGAMTNMRSGVFYSLSAMTTYGHTDLVLEERWKLMGALEALDGWLLFGLTTAFLFWMIQEVSPTRRPRQ
jgi:hypothetical protein